MSAANITQSISHQDDLEFPDFLRVENRTPLSGRAALRSP
jgi:hypothetical protein